MNDSEITLRPNTQTVMSGSNEEKAVIRYDSHFSRIEELIKGNTFSREEIRHLLAVLNSRLDSELEKQPNSGAEGNTEQVMKISGIQRTPTVDRHHLVGRSGTFSETSDILEGVGASPIDIARAYMAGRSSEQGHNLQSYLHKGERTEPKDKYIQQPLTLSPLSRPSICWPGAMLDDHHGHTKQLSQSSRTGLHGFPRTPYSRTGLSRFTTKVKSIPDGVDAYGSVGLIRRMRNKFSSEVRPRGSTILGEPKDILAEVLKSNASTSFLPTKKNLEPGETSGASKCLADDNAPAFPDRDDPITDPSSSQAVRKIREHLERNKPMGKENEAELKLLTSSREENISSFAFVELSSHQKTGIAGLDIPVKFHDSSSNSNNVEKFHEERMDIAKYAAKENPKAPISIFADSGIISGANSVPSFGLKEYSVPAVKNSNKKAFDSTNHGEEKSLLSSCTQLSNGMDVEAAANSMVAEFSKNHGSKPSLPSIFVKKPDFRSICLENGPGFTFPVSTASGGLSEPPTPTIMPTSTSIQSEPSGVPTAVPSYSFGANNPSRPLVFSFASTSNTSISESTDPKFNFGSDKTRLSFSSFECH